MRFLFYIFLIMILPVTVHAQSIIRDAEIEGDIRHMVSPVFKKAGLNPDDVQIILVNDRALNAFVAGGQNIFINTGLIVKTKNVGELIGVIAHETGHIAGGHLIRSQEVGKRASTQAILTTILGAAVGVGGGGNAAGGVMTAGQGSAVSYMLRNSRTYEASADQAAISYMDDAGYSGEGMVTFLNTLAAQELLPETQQDDYLLTHPLSKARVESMRAAVANTRHKDAPWPDDYVRDYERLKAKIDGFLNPTLALSRYDGDNTIPGQYARAIAQYRLGRIDEALTNLNALIADEPNNPYFHELKGQILFENSRIDEAISAYRRADKLAPNTPLIQISLARALLERRDDTLLNDATKLLLSAEIKENQSPQVHRLLATAYGRNGNDGYAKLHVAEEALLKGDKSFAIQQARLAQQILPTDSTAHQQASDIIRLASE